MSVKVSLPAVPSTVSAPPAPSKASTPEYVIPSSVAPFKPLMLTSSLPATHNGVGPAITGEEFDVGEDEAANANGGFVPGEREGIVAPRPIDGVRTPRAVESFDAGVRDPNSASPFQAVDADKLVACGTHNGVGAAAPAKNSMSVKTKPPTPMADSFPVSVKVSLPAVHRRCPYPPRRRKLRRLST